MGSTGEPIGKLGTEVARLSLTSSSISLLRSSHLQSHWPLSSIAQPWKSGTTSSIVRQLRVALTLTFLDPFAASPRHLTSRTESGTTLRIAGRRSSTHVPTLRRPVRKVQAKFTLLSSVSIDHLPCEARKTALCQETYDRMLPVFSDGCATK